MQRSSFRALRSKLEADIPQSHLTDGARTGLGIRQELIRIMTPKLLSHRKLHSVVSTKGSQ